MMRYLEIKQISILILKGVRKKNEQKETEEIKLTTNIQEDLEADSLDLFQIINEIEDEFDVKIETEDGIKTVQDLVTYVEKQTA